MRTNLAFIHSPIGHHAICNAFVVELHIYPHFIVLSRDNHTGTGARMDVAAVPDVREIGFGGFEIYNAPDVVRLLSFHHDSKVFADPRMGTFYGRL